MTQVPVETIPAISEEQRKVVNILFNRATNDMTFTDTSDNLTEKLQSLKIKEQANQLPDATDLAPCLRAIELSVQKLAKINHDKWKQYAKNTARALDTHKIFMPIIVDDKFHIVNGIGRLQLAAEKNQQTITAVVISKKHAEIAKAFTNLLTMDFNIHEKYTDMLRYNSYRRPRGARTYLGRCFTFPLVGKKSSNTFDISDPQNNQAWKKTFGSTVLDFGAGTLDETKLLQENGVRCIPFEPYQLTNNDIDIEKSRASTKQFLDAVANGTKFDSIFLSAIMNSVPYQKDRIKILTIVAALCDANTKVFAVSASIGQTGYRIANGREFVNKNDNNRLQFFLNYEPRVTIADFSKTPKVQKYYTPQEWYDLWKQFFAKAKVTTAVCNVEVIASNPRQITDKELATALEFEFDLPYPKGERMNLVQDAKNAFQRRRQHERQTHNST
jgi:hypothetical protein